MNTYANRRLAEHLAAFLVRLLDHFVETDVVDRLHAVKADAVVHPLRKKPGGTGTLGLSGLCGSLGRC